MIAIFGGSAAFSIYCLHDEMFSSVLEKKINNFHKENNNSISYTVINFGMCSHVVMNEIFTYILFCQEVKPDYIIAHDGANDMISGMISDPYLLNKFNLTYQHELEEWSQKLHETENLSRTQTQMPFHVINLPDNITKAYVERKMQFQRLAESQNCIFIWGLQPLVYSKKSSSIEEMLYFQDIQIHIEMYGNDDTYFNTK